MSKLIRHTKYIFIFGAFSFQEADMKINLDSESSQVSGSIKDLTAALFRSASIAKRNLIARGRVSAYRRC